MTSQTKHIEIKTTEEIADTLDNFSNVFYVPKKDQQKFEQDYQKTINTKWVSLDELQKFLDELNPDEISEDVHDYIMKTFKPKMGGWAKEISPIVWKFWNKLLEALE